MVPSFDECPSWWEDLVLDARVQAETTLVVRPLRCLPDKNLNVHIMHGHMCLEQGRLHCQPKSSTPSHTFPSLHRKVFLFSRPCIGRYVRALKAYIELRVTTLFVVFTFSSIFSSYITFLKVSLCIIQCDCDLRVKRCVGALPLARGYMGNRRQRI